MKSTLLRLNPALTSRFPPKDSYLIGVSGGRDSVALLHFLLASGYKSLRVCHLNHQLQGRAGDATARFVQALAKNWNLPCDLGSVDVRAVAKKRRKSIETAARGVRYEFFGKIARRRECPVIFLAHHADDVVETLLINLFRGSGFAGLAGMREVSGMTNGDVGLTMLRPFLAVWRSDIDAYIKGCRLEFREDATNRNLEPLRNRIRLRALPYLERTLGRNIRASLWRTAQIAGEEEKFLDELFSVKPEPDGGLDAKQLARGEVALQRRTLREWLRGNGISNVGFEVVERVRALLDVKNGPAKTNLPGDRHARRRAGKIFLE